MTDKLSDVHQRIAESVERLPPLSPSVSKVIALANNIDASPRDLLTVIRMDPVLTSKVLQLINSTWFDLSEPITSMNRALVILGYNTIKNVALSCAVVGMLTDGPSQTPASTQLWRHSLWVGVAARSLARARAASRADQELAFVGGLLHDLGEILLLRASPEVWQAIQQSRGATADKLSAERQVLGTTHQEIGGQLGLHWGFPENIRHCLESHHGPVADGRHAILCSTVYLANTLFYFRQGSDGEPKPGPVDPRVWDILSLDETTALAAMVEVSGEVKAARMFLET